MSFDDLNTFIEEHDVLQKSGGPYIGSRGGKWADAAHTIPWKEKQHAGKKEPKGAKTADHASVRELHLYAENDGDLHRQMHEPIRRNLVNKMADGKYDHAQAAQAYSHMMDAASKKYAKEHGSGSGHQFSPAERRMAAKRMANQFHEEATGGELDHHLNKKNKKAVGSLKGYKQAHSGMKSSVREHLKNIDEGKGAGFSGGEHHEHAKKMGWVAKNKNGNHYVTKKGKAAMAASMGGGGSTEKSETANEILDDFLMKAALPLPPRDPGDAEAEKKIEDEQNEAAKSCGMKHGMGGLEKCGSCPMNKCGMKKSGSVACDFECLEDPMEKAEGQGGMPASGVRMSMPGGAVGAKQQAEDGGVVDGTGSPTGAQDPGGPTTVAATAHASGLSQEALSEDDEMDEGQMKPHKKPIETKKSEESYPIEGMRYDHEQVPLIRQMIGGTQFAKSAALQKMDEDALTDIGLDEMPVVDGVQKSERRGPMALAAEEEPELWCQKGGSVLYSDAEDRHIEKALGTTEDNSFYQPPIVNYGTNLHKSAECSNCGAESSAIVSTCEHCGVEKSEGGPVRSHGGGQIFLDDEVKKSLRPEEEDDISWK